MVLGAYDSSGNFTGINQNQDFSSDFLAIAENIPGSTFLHAAESQSIFLPKGGDYDFVYKGTGDGPTTIEIELFSGDTVTPIVTYSEMPTTETTEAEFTVSSDSPENTEINLDLDGNGEKDVSFSPTPENISAPYNFSGFLQPINDTFYQPSLSRSVFKAGSTVPVKFQLKNPEGLLAQGTTAPTWIVPEVISSMNATVGEDVYVLPTSAGNEFKWGPVSQQYIYNWSTKGFRAGKWYRIGVELDDGTTHFVIVGLR